MKVSKELIKGSTSMLVMSVLKNKDLYGYKIIKEIEDIKTIDQELIKYNGGMIKEKPQQEGLRPCTYQYKVNANTVLMAYTQEDLDKLKKNWNLK